MRVVALLSGGLDSTVMVAKLLSEGHEVVALSVNYGQRHVRELRSAVAVTKTLGIHHRILDLTDSMAPILALSNSALTNHYTEVPEGAYDAPSMSQTIVPNRNMLLLASAGAYAASIGFDGVAYAAHAGDHAIYPDCRPNFIKAMKVAFLLCNEPSLHLLTPFAAVDKADIVRIGVATMAPIELTWSCYKGGEVPCGVCGTCDERIKAFAEAGIEDRALLVKLP